MIVQPEMSMGIQFLKCPNYVHPGCTLSTGINNIIYISFQLSDLSFNNIEVIEGLSKLTNLEDLTLYNNRITRIENMEALTKLHVLSLGNNQLKELDQARYCCCCFFVFFFLLLFFLLEYFVWIDF